MLIGSQHIAFNGLFLPLNETFMRARQTAVSVHFSTGVEGWPISNGGTGFLYQFCGRRFCILTRHQLINGFSPEKIVIKLTSDARRLFSGGRIISFPPSYHETEEADLLALELPWVCQNSEYVPIFYDAATVDFEEAAREQLCAIGFPSRLTVISGCEECEGIATSQVMTWGVRGDDSSLPSLCILDSRVMRPRCDGNFDGFSGAPVYGVNPSNKRMTFRGIVIRGGHGTLYFTPREWVDFLCEKAFSEPPLDPVPILPR
ncbi:MAG: hypothetical protein JSS54_12395 [Proteobacteria bacterium]|nr:hypothetical protein [Pseudomonadota bacterium]